jgi:glycosyltransferase involved in cell wall biosynthesis
MVSLSVIVPALNEEAEIRGLLDRLAAQDYAGPVEVIVVDGHSTDRTQQIVRAYPKLRLLIAGPGVAAQRNAGAGAAAGDLLIFLDADNAPGPMFLSALAARYERRPFAVACPWFVPRTRRPDIQAFYALMNGLFFLSQARYHTGAGVCIAVDRNVHLRIGGFDETLHLGEDVDYIQRASALGPHRHLTVRLHTSARRIEAEGLLRIARLYARISPALLTGDRDTLRGIAYSPVRLPAEREASDSRER